MKEDILELIADSRLDPRQRDFWAKYIDPSSPTYSNGYKTGIAAGYTKSYSRNLRNQGWFKAKVRRTNLQGKAEQILDRILNMESDKADIMRVQSDVAKHITKTLGKDDGYSERTEQVGGGNIVFLPQELIEKFNLSEPKKE